MKQYVSTQDFAFLAKLAGLQKALITSCTSPVTIRKQEEGGLGEGIFLAMYYDCADNEDLAKEVMEKRIKLSREDIINHVNFHEFALKSFLYMDRMIVEDNRKDLAESCEELCDKTREYLDLVENHNKRLKTDGFLIYPVCFPGHWFHIWQGDIARELMFNPESKYERAKSDLNSIQINSIISKELGDKLPYISMPLQTDQKSGLYDNNFRQNLSISKSLLEKAGLKID